MRFLDVVDEDEDDFFEPKRLNRFILPFRDADDECEHSVSLCRRVRVAILIV